MHTTPDVPYAQIRRAARGALRAAGVNADTKLPIPVSEVALAAGLHRDVLFDLGANDEVPLRFRKFLNRIKGVVLGALDIPEKRIYLDGGVTGSRARFTEAHEIGHDALPWHAGAYFGDTQSTLDKHTEAGLETEANAFAADILFGIERFSAQADDYRASIDVPLGLNGMYATSAHATVRRYVELSRHEIALVIAGRLPSRIGPPSVPIWGTYESQSFRQRYGPLSSSWSGRLHEASYPLLQQLLGGTPTRVDECSVTLDTTRGKTALLAEGFNNGRVNMVLIRRKKATAGRPIRLLGLNGEPLSVA